MRRPSPPSSTAASAATFSARRRRGAFPLQVRAAAVAADGPSCLYVGPIDTASKEKLEALYHQARDSYYSGNPLIVDDMFDKVELKLRLYGSKSVVKYPRCSIRRHAAYSDAEEDPSQVFALAIVWMLLLAFGTSTFYATNLAFKDIVNSRYLLYNRSSFYELVRLVNEILFVPLGLLVGYPIALASVLSLQGLLNRDLFAVKGSCPNCGEEVFAFVRAERLTKRPIHRANCHVCGSVLEFSIKVEQSFSTPSKRWVYGRIYLVQPV